MLQNMKIGMKLYLGFGVVLLVFAMLGVFTYFGLSDSAHKAHEIDKKYYKRAYYAVEMKQNVTDVWQWLTDVSATHFTDGYDEAEAHAKAFKEALAEMKKLYPAGETRLPAIDASFDKFYEVGKKMAKAYIEEGVEGGNKVMEEFDGAGEDIQKRVTLLKDETEKTVESHLDDIMNGLNTAKSVNIIALIIAIILGLGAAVFITRLIVNPINNVVAMLKDIAEGEGDLTKRIEHNSNDEVGELAVWFNRFVDDLNRMMVNISHSAETVSSNSEEMTASTTEVSKAIQDVAETIQTLSQGVDGQSRSVEGVSQRMNELNSAAEEIASSSQNTADLANQVSENAEEGSKALTSAVQKMNVIRLSTKAASSTIDQLSQEAQKIGNIVSTITTIAEQTNLLALNAAIEAARAGEQGRGFAVVADEVRKLAENSAAAAGEITKLVTGIQGSTSKAVDAMESGNKEVSEGVQIVNTAGTSIEEILNLVKKVSNNIQDVSAAAEEQAASFTEVTNEMANITKVAEESSAGMQSISANIEETNASVEEINAGSQGLSDQAVKLSEIVNKFKIEEKSKEKGLREV